MPVLRGISLLLGGSPKQQSRLMRRQDVHGELRPSPAHQALVVVDDVNTCFDRVAFERSEIDKFLRF
jgi:hypothetical protein